MSLLRKLEVVSQALVFKQITARGICMETQLETGGKRSDADLPGRGSEKPDFSLASGRVRWEQRQHPLTGQRGASKAGRRDPLARAVFPFLLLFPLPRNSVPPLPPQENGREAPSRPTSQRQTDGSTSQDLPVPETTVGARPPCPVCASPALNSFLDKFTGEQMNSRKRPQEQPTSLFEG